MSMSGGIYEGPGGVKLHGDGKPVGTTSYTSTRQISVKELEHTVTVLEHYRDWFEHHHGRCIAYQDLKKEAARLQTLINPK